MHALYALDGLKALDAAPVLTALADPEPRVREHALRLAEHFRDNPNVLARMDKMTEDADIGVRYQLAFSLGAFPTETAVRSLVKLAHRDGTDSWFRLAVLSGVNERQGEVFRRL